MRIRQNFDNVHLAHVFGSDEATISRIINAWIPFLAAKLRPWVAWVPKEKQSKPPKCFDLFPKCVGVIDCFELVVEKSGSAIDRQYFWSQYKHNYTAKFLVCVAPNTTIMHISKAWGGRTSDKHIVEHDDVFLANLRAGDVLLADRGFDVKEFLLMLRRVQVLMPKFMTAQQFSRKDIEISRKLSSARIHVERAIGQLRNFDILNNKLPANLLPLLDSIVFICCAICNMHPPLIKE